MVLSSSTLVFAVVTLNAASTLAAPLSQSNVDLELAVRDDSYAAMQYMEKRKGGGGHGGGGHGGGGGGHGGGGRGGAGHSSSTGGGKGHSSSIGNIGKTIGKEGLKDLGKDLLKDQADKLLQPTATPGALPTPQFRLPHFRIGGIHFRREEMESLERRKGGGGKGGGGKGGGGKSGGGKSGGGGGGGFLDKAVSFGKKAAKKGFNFAKDHKEEIGQVAQVALPLILGVREDEIRSRDETAELKAREGSDLELRDEPAILEFEARDELTDNLESRDFIDYNLDELD